MDLFNFTGGIDNGPSFPLLFIIDFEVYQEFNLQEAENENQL